MARITVEDCLEKMTNRFGLVMLVAKRAKQLMKGSHLTVETDDNKHIVNALREVAHGSVAFEADPNDGAPEEQIERDLNR
ncbi:MAG TPA: DNA-directed RNA polymerase subunit omega [Bdellovibrionales bacterium]|nr:DNA-directed RNA polymerase subunit omega [Bdellovibrionales bacterium]